MEMEMEKKKTKEMNVTKQKGRKVTEYSEWNDEMTEKLKQKKLKRDETNIKKNHSIWNQQNLLFHISTFAMNNVQSFGVLTRVNKLWQSVLKRNNQLWWPLFNRMWAAFELEHVDHENLDFAKFLREKVISQNPQQFSPQCKGGSWQEQYQAVCHYIRPRLVFYDCSDGQAFIPQAGWLTALDHENIHIYDNLRYTENPIAIVKQMIEIHFDNLQENLSFDMHHIAGRFLEFHYRLKNRHNFCCHWTLLTDDQCFPPKSNSNLNSVSLKNQNLKRIPNSDLHQSLFYYKQNTQKNAKPTIHTITCHDPSSGWMCQDRCMGMVRSGGAEYESLFIFSGTIQTHMTAFSSIENILAETRSIENRMRKRAGYNDEHNDYLTITPCVNAYCSELQLLHTIISWKEIHTQAWPIGICGYHYLVASQMICCKFKFSNCTLNCTDLDKHYRNGFIYTGKNKVANKPGCGRYLGPGVVRHSWKYKKCNHHGSSVNQVDYCFDCAEYYNTISEFWECPECTKQKLLDSKL
jgi:hypothetical protein